MLALMLLPLLSAAPKDCKDDVSCLEAAAKDCSPAVYRYRGPLMTMGAKTTGEVTITVHGPKKKACEVETETAIIQLQIDPDLAQMFRPDAGPEERNALLAQMEQLALSSPLLHMTCELDKAKAQDWVHQYQPTNHSFHGELGDDPYETCTPTQCGGKPPLEKDCVFTGCGQGGWHIKCGKPPVECALGVQALLTPNCETRCWVPKDKNGNKLPPQATTSCH